MYLTFVHMRPLINVKCDIEKILDGNISYLLTYFHFSAFLKISATNGYTFKPVFCYSL